MTGPDGIRVLYTAEVIAREVERLAIRIASSGLDRLLAIAVLKGSFVFAADLLRALHKAGVEPEVDFLSLSSYRTGRHRPAPFRWCAMSRATFAIATFC